MRIWLALVGSIIYLFILLQLQTPDIGGQGTTSEVVQSVMKIIQSKGQLTAELWAVCTHHQRVCGCGQELTITEDARLFSIITGERMVSFVFFSLREDQSTDKPFPHMQTCSHLHNLFCSTPWFITPHTKIVLPVWLIQLKNKHTTSEQNNDAWNLHTLGNVTADFYFLIKIKYLKSKFLVCF